MLYDWLIYGALAVCGAGAAYRFYSWFRRDLEPRGRRASVLERFRGAAAEAGKTLFSRRALNLARALVLDVLLLRKLFQAGPLRWAVHVAVSGGIMVLLVMHALDGVLMTRLFPGYEPTLNPYLFLRNAAGVLVLAGLAAAAARRIRDRARRAFTNRDDVFLILILAAVTASGFLLEASKIVSRSDFDRMVQEWAYIEDPAEVRALDAYWVRELGLSPAHGESRPSAETLALGREVHEMNCMGCHADPASAFASYGISRGLRPAGGLLDRIGAPAILWWLHVLLALTALALLPFTKLFHVVATPLSLLVNAATDRERLGSEATRVLQMIELDACTHCGVCTTNCAVGVCFEALPNPDILPSEKTGALRKWAQKRPFSTKRIKRLQEGLFVCTNCTRCTGVCPSGIDLQALWQNAREILLRETPPMPLVFSTLSFYRAMRGGDRYGEPLEDADAALSSRWSAAQVPGPLVALDGTSEGVSRDLKRSLEGGTFSRCYRCSTCSNACPVVTSYKHPARDLGLLPHQIMHAAGLGLGDLLFNCRMLWYCLGCYQCQEHCPQGVRVTDVLYELKNLAMKSERAAFEAGTPAGRDGSTRNREAGRRTGTNSQTRGSEECEDKP